MPRSELLDERRAIASCGLDELTCSLTTTVVAPKDSDLQKKRRQRPRLLRRLYQLPTPVLRIVMSGDKAVLLQSLQSIAEDVRRDAFIGRELREGAVTHDDEVTQDDERPRVTHEVEGTGDRAV